MVEVEQISSADDQLPKPQQNEVIEVGKITPNFEHSYEKCFLCELEHDSPEFGPYCALCHDFLYPNVLLLHERKLGSVNLVTEDCSLNLLASESCELNVISGVVVLKTEDSRCESENEKTSDLQRNSTNRESAVVPGHKLPYLSLYERVRAPDLVTQRLANELRFVEEDLFETLPPESELKKISSSQWCDFNYYYRADSTSRQSESHVLSGCQINV